MTFTRINFSIIFLVLSGCANIGSKYIKPQMPQLPTHFSIGKSKSKVNIDTLKWWESFNDTRLNELVAIALKQNLSVLQAIERINAAKENIIASKANLLPSLNASASSEIMPKSHKNSIIKSESSWEIDLFGQKHHATESALAQLGKVYAESDMTKLTIISGLIPSYIEARHFQERICIAHEILSLYQKTLALTQIKFAEGAISKLDLIKLKVEISSMESEIPNLEKGLRVNIHNISTILGYPATELFSYMEKQQNSFKPNLYMKIDIGIPANLIRNRPDIRYSEKNLEDAVAKIGVAKADLYPSISLNGSISMTYDNLITPGYNHGWSFGPKIYIPIFNGWKIRSNIRIAEYNAREQYIIWEKTVLNAIKEVEDALVSINEDKKIVTILQHQVESYKKSMELLMIGYKQGIVSFLDILDIQRTIAKKRIDLSIAKRQLTKSYVNLYIAIGSGYNS